MDWSAAAGSLISPSYLQQGQQAIQRRKKQFRSLLSERRLPSKGWDDQSIELFLQVRLAKSRRAERQPSRGVQLYLEPLDFAGGRCHGQQQFLGQCRSR